MDIQINQILFQLFNFSVVLFLLNKFLYKPVKNILNQRTKKIESGLLAAEKNLKAQKELDNDKKQAQLESQKQAAKILSEAKKEANKDAQAIIKNAKEDASKLLEKERNSMKASFSQEKRELQKTLSKLVTQTTEQLLKKYLTKSEQQKIINAQLKELKNISLT